jgi:hypothetical protein
VLGDAEVVQRQGEHGGVGGAQLAGQLGGQGERRALGVGALLVGGVRAADGGGPGVGGQRVGGEVTAHHGPLGVDGGPLGEDEVGQLGAGGPGALDAGVDAEQGHGGVSQSGWVECSTQA